MIQSNKTVWTIHTYAGINITDNTMKVWFKYIRNRPQKTMLSVHVTKDIISGQDQPDDQPEQRLQLS